MTITVHVCDICQRSCREIEMTIRVDDGSDSWDVCARCERRPFKRPTASERAEAQMVMANELKARAGRVFAMGEEVVNQAPSS